MKVRTYMCFPDFKEKAVTFSYDDGVIYDKRLIEIFTENKLKGTFNVNSGFFGTHRRLNREDAVELYTRSGMEVAVHGVKHLSLANVDIAAATNDVIQDRKELESAFGCIIKGMAYANGSYDDCVIEMLKNCGINYSRTAAQSGSLDLPTNWHAWTGTCHHDNPNLMDYAKQLVEYKHADYFWAYRPKLLYVWGHSYEFNDKGNWNVIEDFAKFIGGREDIWYATNGEIYDYVTAFDNLEWSVDCSLVKNNSAIDVFINYLGKKCVVKAGQTAKI